MVLPLTSSPLAGKTNGAILKTFIYIVPVRGCEGLLGSSKRTTPTKANIMTVHILHWASYNCLSPVDH